jgi:integrase
MKAIMDRYKVDSDLVFAHFMPDIEDQEQYEKEHAKILGWIGNNLKNIAGQAGIPNHDEIVFYSARHTFAAHYILYEKNPSMFRLMECLGHSSEKSTHSYLARLMGTKNVKPLDFYNEMFEQKGS